MVSALHDRSIKSKIRILAFAIVLSTVGVLFFQIKWLQSSYQTTRNQLAVEGDKVLNRVLIERKKLAADTIRTLLRKVVKSEKDFEFRLQTFKRENGVIYTDILYDNVMPTPNSYASYAISQSEVALAKSNPYQFFLKKIEQLDFDQLEGICARLVMSADLNFPKGSEKDKILWQMVRYYQALYQDTKSLHRLCRKEVAKMGGNIRYSVEFMTSITNAPDKKIFDNYGGESEEVVEVLMEAPKKLKFDEKLDKLNASIKGLNKDSGDIYIVKPIFDFKNYESAATIPAVVLILMPSKAYYISEMLIGIISSLILLILIGASLAYMIYLLIRQKKLSDMKNDFINNMSHELKTPVATALAAIQGMQFFEVLKDERKTQSYLNTAASEMKRLSDMISNILNSAVFESGDFTLKLTSFNFQELLNDIAGNQQQLAKKEVNVTVDYSGDVQIVGDQAHLYNVFSNLIDNAIKYSGDKVSIFLAVTKSDHELKIVVVDNGNGIPIDYKKQIFDQFFRVPSQQDHSVKGHGLGLSYVKNIIEKHGGTIILAKSSNEGSTFEINLPQ